MGLNQVVTVREVMGVSVVDAGRSSLTYDCSGGLIGPVTQLVAEGKKKLLVNLSQIETVHRIGLGELVRSYKAAHEQGAVLKVVVAPASKVQEYLVITKLAKVFEVFHDEGEAVRSFQS